MAVYSERTSVEAVMDSSRAIEASAPSTVELWMAVHPMAMFLRRIDSFAQPNGIVSETFNDDEGATMLPIASLASCNERAVFLDSPSSSP